MVSKRQKLLTTQNGFRIFNKFELSVYIYIYMCVGARTHTDIHLHTYICFNGTEYNIVSGISCKICFLCGCNSGYRIRFKYIKRVKCFSMLRLET